jgi:hypothetical protein
MLAIRQLTPNWSQVMSEQFERIGSMNFLQIEKSIKRRLSDAEIAAIEKIGEHLPVEKRKRKRLLRQARERARKAELAVRKRAGLLREPSDEDFRVAMSALSHWQTADGFVRAVEALGRQVPSEKLWGNRYKGLREAMTLAELCKHHGKISAVRMGKDPPDAFMRFADTAGEEVEITEVQETGRRRGDEYRRGGSALSTFVPNDRVDARAEAIVLELQKAVEAKAGKYQFKPNLLIYLNYPHDERAEPRLLAAIADMRSKYVDQFRGIFVVTDRKLL